MMNITALAEQMVLGAKHGLAPALIDKRLLAANPGLTREALSAAWRTPRSDFVPLEKVGGVGRTGRRASTRSPER